jgi:hypothetical protein
MLMQSQSAFTSRNLIYCYLNGGHTWHPMETCVWNGPVCLSKYLVMSSIYEQDQQAVLLFKDLLKMGNASHEHLVGELRHMSSSGSIPERKKLLDLYGGLAAACHDKDTRTFIQYG